MNNYIDCKLTTSRYIERKPTVEAYLRDIREYQVLSFEEQLDLLEKAKSSDELIRKKAIDKIVETNQRFVLSIAKKYSNSENLLDLINEGNIGLIEAIKNYNPKSGNSFLTYAVWWIRKYISNFLIIDRSFVKCNNQDKLSRIIPKIKAQLFGKYGREASFDEVNEALQEQYGCQMTDEKEFIGVHKCTIDVETEETEDESQKAKILFNIKTATDNVTENIDYNYLKDFTNFLINKLTEKEKNVVTKKFGIGCSEMSIVSIANELNVSDNTVRNILKRASNKLKTYENYNKFNRGAY